MLAKNFIKLLKKAKAKDIKVTIADSDTGQDPWVMYDLPYRMQTRLISEFGLEDFLKQFKNKKVLIKDVRDVYQQRSRIKAFKFYIHTPKLMTYKPPQK